MHTRLRCHCVYRYHILRCSCAVLQRTTAFVPFIPCGCYAPHVRLLHSAVLTLRFSSAIRGCSGCTLHTHARLRTTFTYELRITFAWFAVAYYVADYAAAYTPRVYCGSLRFAHTPFYHCGWLRFICHHRSFASVRSWFGCGCLPFAAVGLRTLCYHACLWYRTLHGCGLPARLHMVFYTCLPGFVVRYYLPVLLRLRCTTPVPPQFTTHCLVYIHFAFTFTHGCRAHVCGYLLPLRYLPRCRTHAVTGSTTRFTLPSCLRLHLYLHAFWVLPTYYGWVLCCTLHHLTHRFTVARTPFCTRFRFARIYAHYTHYGCYYGFGSTTTGSRVLVCRHWLPSVTFRAGCYTVLPPLRRRLRFAFAVLRTRVYVCLVLRGCRVRLRCIRFWFGYGSCPALACHACGYRARARCLVRATRLLLPVHTALPRLPLPRLGSLQHTCRMLTRSSRLSV